MAHRARCLPPLAEESAKRRKNDGAVEAHDLSGGQEADRGGTESKVGEGEESGLTSAPQRASFFA
jgi:hypothetical protein